MSQIPASFQNLMGDWVGPFRKYDQQVRAFRPYWSQLTFSAHRCIRVTDGGPDQGDVLLIGEEVETYDEFRPPDPAMPVLSPTTDTNYVIYGLKGGDPSKVYLRFVDSKSNVTTYEMEYFNAAARANAFRYVLPAEGTRPRMVFSVLGWQDPTTDDMDTRYLAVTLTIGSDDDPSLQVIINGGKQYHSSKPVPPAAVAAATPETAPSPTTGPAPKIVAMPVTTRLPTQTTDAMGSALQDNKAKTVLRKFTRSAPN